VFDLDSVQLLGALRTLITEGRFLGGSKVESPVWAYLGAAANPNADPLPAHVRRLGKKIRAGARFIQTQGIFDLERFEKWMALVREQGWHRQAKILAGVIPLRSLRAARYMREEVPGVVIPDELMGRLEKAPRAKEEGIKICVEIIERLKETEGVAGIHIMAIGWDEVVPEIVTRAGLYPRPAGD
jgi:methylenetetrahydrofolate reductase (NADPH)